MTGQQPTRATLGKRFADARHSAQMTQQQVAEAVGLSRASVANFENGRQDVPVTKALAMCEAVDVPLCYLTRPVKR